jgi:transposase
VTNGSESGNRGGLNVLRGKDVEEIIELKREGLSIRAINWLTGYDRKTIRRYLLKPEGRPVYGPRPAAVSKLEAFKPYLKDRLQAGVWKKEQMRRIENAAYSAAI